MRKDEIITALKTKYLGFALSNEAIDRIASAKEKTVTEDTDIDAAISDFATMELIANEVKKNADKERRARSDLQKSFDDYKTAHPETVETKTETKTEEENEPEWAKKLREQNAALTKRLDEQDKTAKRKATIDAAIAFAKKNGCTDEKGLKLTQSLFHLKDDESEEDASNRFKSEYDATMKEYFGDGTVPPVGGGGINSDSDFEKSMKAFAESKGLGEKKAES